MSNKDKFRDRTPFIKNAGLMANSSNINSDHSIRQDVYFKPQTETPERIKKYRKSNKEIPGVKQIHYGVYNDPRYFENFVHGVKTLESEHVNDCITGNNLSGIEYFSNTIKEDKYQRNQREPLGQSLRRNYIFPEATKHENFKFGIPTLGYHNAKEILYPRDLPNETDLVKSQYKKSHWLSDPGEQINRDYKWNVDKNTHVFGKPQAREVDGCKKSLENDLLDASYPKTIIVNKRLEDFRQATSDMIGKTKFKGTLNSSINENNTFGLNKVSGSDWDVAKCLHGDPNEKTEKHLEPDPDLGKSFLYKSKLQNLHPKTPDPNRTYGVPSIRFDMKKNMTNSNSVTNYTNYGNEKDVFELLYPNPHLVRGVDDPDFDELIDKDQLKEILIKEGYNFSDAEYNIIYQLALKNNPNTSEKISIKSFINVMKILKKEFVKYKKLFN